MRCEKAAGSFQSRGGEVIEHRGNEPGMTVSVGDTVFHEIHGAVDEDEEPMLPRCIDANWNCRHITAGTA